MIRRFSRCIMIHMSMDEIIPILHFSFLHDLDNHLGIL